MIEKLIALLYKNKICVHLRTGDLIASQNNYSIHCKKIMVMNHIKSAKQRWMIKTVNVNDYDRIKKYTVENKGYLVNG